VTLADDLQTVWQAPTTDGRLKKRIVRAVIKEVVADFDAEAGTDRGILNRNKLTTGR
jgi:hypothetical protein